MDQENQNAQYSSNQLIEALDDNADNLDAEAISDNNTGQILYDMNCDENTVSIDTNDMDKTEDVLKLRHLDQDTTTDETLNVDCIVREIPPTGFSLERNSSIGSGDREYTSGKSSDHNVHSKKTHKCDVCTKTFYGEGNLRVNTGERPYKCPECGKTFKEKFQLDHYLRFHTEERPYKCSECGKSFKQKCHLRDHLKVHTGEKPYKCAECEKSFKQKSQLKQHFTQVHTGVRPYKCSLCGKYFSRKYQLANHLSIHTRKSP